MISVLIYLLVLCLVFGVAWWILQLIPLPQPAMMIVQVILALILLLILLDVVLGGRFLALPRWGPA